MLLILVWAALVIAAPFAGVGRMKIDGDGARAFMVAAKSEAIGHRGNLALVLIENKQIAQSHTMSIGKPVTGDTLFQMASVSKWVAAWGVLALVEAGKIDLDAPVSRYLTRWKLPSGAYRNDQVTVRRLLSHTAGLDDDLGYCGFAANQPIQSLEASLTKAADACPLRTGKVHVGEPAGTWRYSGGGYTLLQLLVEEVSGEPFADYMQRAVLNPLGMTRSTYRTGAKGSRNVATFFDGGGSVAPHYRYTAAAAASLYASANDLARFAQAHFVGPAGEVPGRGVVSPRTLLDMRRPQAKIAGIPHWGLGPRLYAAAKDGGFVFGHDGGNVPAINTTVRIDAGSGDAIVALSTGGSSLIGGGGGIASMLGGEWTAQRRAAITPIMIYGEAQRLIRWIVGGMVLIVIGGVIARRRQRRRG
jgi:CubicO group peptidase (beta-lactamase class C family)